MICRVGEPRPRFGFEVVSGRQTMFKARVANFDGVEISDAPIADLGASLTISS